MGGGMGCKAVDCTLAEGPVRLGSFAAFMF